ncbi:hypothetical protein [Aquisphaera insulae]|uniref:hypothetical protein n=1 Tax=Aquisphaera insulae TaxID=2712864 RepID=UPI0013EC8532|nr:hypothetical protein [Aquisphaera insulae]
MESRKGCDGPTSQPFVALLVGLIVSAMAFDIAYRGNRGVYPYRSYLGQTQAQMDLLEQAIEAHRKVSGHLPASLAELDIVKRKERFELDSQGRPLGAGPIPYHYQAEGDRYTLFWPGNDGRPGGYGLDADVYPKSTGRPIDPITFRQFVFDLPTRGILWSSVLAGGFAGLACLQVSQSHRGIGFAVWVVITSAAALLMALIMAAIHYPSGH